MRFVIMGVKKAITESVQLPSGTFSENTYHSVFDAISDIEDINTEMPFKMVKSEYDKVNL
jgi:hypothetical protein